MYKKFLIGALVAVIIATFSAKNLAVSAAPQALTQSAEFGNPQLLQSSLPYYSLSNQEIDALTYMYQEEKLARDVYTKLYGYWKLSVFQNIAASEQKHMDAVKTLLDRYGLASPTSSAGIFVDPALQALYTDLVARGSQSLALALKVGATVEEIDILDLQSRLKQTTNPEIQMVYNNLMAGSYNHLRSFTAVLTRQTGEVYQPQYLDLSVYQSIVNGAADSGQGMGSSAGGRRNGINGRP